MIVAEGAAGDEAYIVLRGTCEASRTIDRTSRVLRQMGPGEVFGETAILTAQPRSATVTAVSEVVVAVVTRAALEGQLPGASWVGALARALASRLREAEARADDRARLRHRVAEAVRVHAALIGERGPGPQALAWPPLRRALAVALAVDEAAVDQALRDAVAAGDGLELEGELIAVTRAG